MRSQWFLLFLGKKNTPAMRYSLVKGNKCAKKADRVKLIDDIIGLDSSTFLPSLFKDDPMVRHWYFTNTAHARNPKTWNLPILAKAICSFDDILRKSSTMVARDAKTLPEPIKAFHKFMEDVREAAILLKNQGYRERGGKIGGQKDGEYIQDKVDLTDLENTSFDVENCASCRHRFLLPVGRDIVEITWYNQQVRSQHTKAMMIWHSASRSRKASKPQAGKSITQQLACMGQKLHCLSNNTGHGCFTCEQACKNAIAAGRNDRPYFDKDFKCACPVCACECSVLYYRHQGKYLATQAQKDRDEALGQKKQPTMDAFYQFTKKIVESNNEQYEEQYEEIEDVKEEECTNNAMGMVAVKMMDDETIQNDNSMRYGLQKRVGDLETTSSNGESIQTLREKGERKCLSQKLKRQHILVQRGRGGR